VKIIELLKRLWLWLSGLFRPGPAASNSPGADAPNSEVSRPSDQPERHEP
jgi:hypothetical protein